MPDRSVKVVIQPDTKSRRVFVGPYRSKLDPYVLPHKIKILQPHNVHSLIN
jgi:hypothetical protein